MTRLHSTNNEASTPNFKYHLLNSFEFCIYIPSLFFPNCGKLLRKQKYYNKKENEIDRKEKKFQLRSKNICFS